jgi:hypothetical protein
MFDRLKSFLFEPKSIAPLVVFRIIFGLATFISTARFLYLGWVDLHFVNTQVQFKYFGFEWVQLATSSIMYVLHYLMLAASLGIVFGAFYRVSAIVFFISFTYCELIDITYYLNHYYFVSLIAFLLIWMPANAHFSWDASCLMLLCNQTSWLTSRFVKTCRSGFASFPKPKDWRPRGPGIAPPPIQTP